MIGQSMRIDPVISSPCTRIDLHALWQQLDDLFIPLPHLSTRIPKGTHDSAEVAPFSIPQVLDEGRALEVRRRWVCENKLRPEIAVEFLVVVDRLAQVEDDGFARRNTVKRAGERHLWRRGVRERHVGVAAAARE